MILHNFVSPCCIKCRNKLRCEKHCFPSLILYLLQEILRIYGINVLWKMQRENILSGIFISFLDAHIKSNCQKCVCRVKFLLVKRMTMLKATSLLQPSSFFSFFLSSRVRPKSRHQQLLLPQRRGTWVVEGGRKVLQDPSVQKVQSNKKSSYISFKYLWFSFLYSIYT